MFFCDKTFASPAMNLAFDEALLLTDSEALPAQDSPSYLRLWEADKPLVVLGRSSRVEQEMNTKLCREKNIPVLRRVSGGATIVSGPGCLMYAVVLNADQESKSLNVDSAHQYVLGKMVKALRETDQSVKIAGTSDLVVETPQALIKFSGNSVRMVRSRILYHGTILYDFDLPTISALLGTPPRQPDYRQQRSHQEFVGNLNAKRAELVRSIQSVWSHTNGKLDPIDEIKMNRLISQAEKLVEQKYQTDDWNYSR